MVIDDRARAALRVLGMSDEELDEMTVRMFHECPKGVVDVAEEDTVEDMVDVVILHKTVILDSTHVWVPDYIRECDEVNNGVPDTRCDTLWC